MVDYYLKHLTQPGNNRYTTNPLIILLKVVHSIFIDNYWYSQSKKEIQMPVITTKVLPDNPTADNIYSLIPNNTDPTFYSERTDRNIGWITRDEQEMLRQKTVGISGCGGMGGLVASVLLRVGIGHIKIADVESFDVSNMNRQFGATRKTIGTSKAFATARALRDITDDTNIDVFPRGINENDVDAFLDGCDVVLDEIEYWAIGARILLHQRARERNIPIINCNTIGFGTRLFFFTPDSATMEECMGLSYEEARALETKIANRTATAEDKAQVMGAVTRALVPDIPTYNSLSETCGHPDAINKRLFEEGKAPIIGSNPPLASGFVSDHTLLYLLKDSAIKRDTIKLPQMPNYLYFDAGHMQAEIRKILHVQSNVKEAVAEVA